MFKKHSIKPAGFILIALVTLMVISPNRVFALEKPALEKTILLENAVELPSERINAKVIRVIFPPAFKTPWHTHEGPGPRYVVKGALQVIEEGKTHTYSAGEVFWESGGRMSVENKGTDSAELIIFELAPVKQEDLRGE
jgi:quercetin dioxygenase-like cupin family protein